MSIAEFSIKNKLLSVIVIVISLVGGWNAYQTMPRFEDPEFTIRTALVLTEYPGASPEEVAREVSDPLITALQQLQEVDEIKAKSSSGFSELTVDVKYEFSKSKEDLQVIWAKLRNKVKDADRTLPREASPPIVNDDFGDLYGLYYFITGEDYSAADLRTYAKQLKREILQVPGVAKVQLLGEQQEAIFVEISAENRAALGTSTSRLYEILGNQNAVVDAGSVRVGEQRIVIDPTGAIDSVSAIENLQVSADADGKIVYLKDIAHVYRGYQTPATRIIRYDGKEAIALGVSNVSGGNVVDIGEAVDRRMREAESRRPIDIEVIEYYHQGKIVQAAIDDFVVNVIAALTIVIVTLLIFMGLRSALVIGSILLLTI
ncbi:MAG: efflux RND transporter permease subunit, partial [Desulfocapsaceae bacterium]